MLPVREQGGVLSGGGSGIEIRAAAAPESVGMASRLVLLVEAGGAGEEESSTAGAVEIATTGAATSCAGVATSTLAAAGTGTGTGAGTDAAALEASTGD
jgi:hypothetical protein